MALLICAGLLTSGGCRKRAPADGTAKDKLKAETKPDFEPQKFVTRPNDGVRSEMALKRGHWSSTDLEAIANRGDARGQLTAQLFDGPGVPIDVGPTPFRVVFARPVVLAKGQLRQIEASLYCPAYTDPKQAVSRMAGDQGRELFGTRSPVALLDRHQWYFVVLARQGDRYRFLPDLDSIRAPDAEHPGDERVPHYRVRIMAPGTRLELAPSGQGWTSTAYVLWDDREPSDLSADQQQAMLDWLHWGGQLIVSGPETLSTLRGSFLEPHLPASAGGTAEIDSAALAPLVALTPYDEPLRVYKPWSGVKLIPKPGATCPQKLQQDFKPPLLLERRVGRGRVVVTAFSLGERKLREWPEFDAFFNACLLRRVGRRYVDLVDGLSTIRWSDWDPDSRLPPDPARTSQVRYFSRDAHEPPKRKTNESEQSDANENASGNRTDWYSDEYQAFAPPGVAGWDDLSAVSNAARDALREAAGITVPPASFVFWALALYLTALVPVNWLVFKLVGRVEWAWAAAPVVALAGAVGVIWSAQLNIGFSHAHSEVGIIELQPDCDRAHLTRYTAIYSSLGASYRLQFDDPSAVALPFFTGVQVLAGQHRDTVKLRRLPAAADDDRAGLVSLDGFQVASNSTGMVHSEQTLPLTGGIRLVRLTGRRCRLENHTPWKVEHAALVGQQESAIVGTFGPGEQREVSLVDQSAADERLFPSTTIEGLDLRKLIVIATDKSNLESDGLCLVGLVAGPIPGLEIEPATVPAHIANLVMAHLDYGPLGAPNVDKNVRPAAGPIQQPE